MTVADRVVCFGAVLVAVACAPAPTRHGHWDALCANLDPEQVLVPIRTVAPRFPQGLLAEMPSEAWVDVQFSIDDDAGSNRHLARGPGFARGTNRFAHPALMRGSRFTTHFNCYS